jgi:hypothetical protein
MRPETERRLREGFQRSVDKQRGRYTAQLAYAGQMSARFECGAVVGVFVAQAGGGIASRAYVKGLLPLAAIPVLIAGALVGVPHILPVLLVFPFAVGAWFGLSLWRGRQPKRPIWFCAFTRGFMYLDGPRSDTVPVLWDSVTEVREVWNDVYDFVAEESRPTLSAYALCLADGKTREVSRSFQNVEDPYANVGRMLKGMTPSSFGSTMPSFPVIDEIIATYAKRPAPGT